MSPEIIQSPRRRLEYGAVPLRPWQAKYPGTDQSYFEASRQHLETKAQDAVANNHFLHDSERAVLGKFLTESLLSTHTSRIDYNHDSFNALAELEAPCAALQYAYEGLATPSELLEILAAHPEIKALELAKLSHPLDFTASRPMDDAIVEMLHDKNAEMLTSETRYKRKRLQPEIPALIVVRKTELGDIRAKNGLIRITQRQSLLVRGDTDPADISAARVVKNDQRFEELSRKIETYFQPENFNSADQFVQPAATSYYAKFLETE